MPNILRKFHSRTTRSILFRSQSQQNSEVHLTIYKIPPEDGEISNHCNTMGSSSIATMRLCCCVLAWSFMACATASNFTKDFDIIWGDSRAKILNNGQLLTLSLDNSSGSGFQSKQQYLYTKMDMQIKLVAGNSAGTVAAYYMKANGSEHDEIDFEFLGNVTGDPYTVHTNVFTQGKGNREQQFQLWFDPSKAFHTYSILWNPQNIIFLVDGIPIRDYKNLEAHAVQFPKNQPMLVHSSLWAAEDWATRGGLVKANWTQAPFTASYRGFSASTNQSEAWFNQTMDAKRRSWLRWVQKKYMIYNYCTDKKRFPDGIPPECSLS